MSNGEESHAQRRQMTLLMLPDDLIFNCLGRISRLYYPTLSLVSKRFRSLLASHKLYKTRSFLGRTESSLYVFLKIYTNSNQLRWCWFTLCRKPNSSSKILVPISSPNSPSECKSSVAAVDSSIYAIGCAVNGNASSRFMVMDCHSHIFREGPSMQMARLSPSVCVLDGKIYVTGGCENADSTNWIEVFDTKSQSWEFLQIPSEEICLGSKYRTAGCEGTIYVRSEEKNMTYKLHKGKWRSADLALNSILYRSNYCVIDNVFYHCNSWEIRWYDSNERIWRALKGLPRSFMSFRNHRGIFATRLVDYGGNMVVLWEEYKTLNHQTKKIIWCAEIELEITQEREIWGTLKWFDVVLITNQRNELVDAVSTIV